MWLGCLLSTENYSTWTLKRMVRISSLITNNIVLNPSIHSLWIGFATCFIWIPVLKTARHFWRNVFFYKRFFFNHHSRSAFEIWEWTSNTWKCLTNCKVVLIAQKKHSFTKHSLSVCELGQRSHIHKADFN